MVILLNPDARQGRGAAKWDAIKGAPDMPEASVISIKNHEWRMQMKLHIQRGETRFIAAGGDGTVNLLLNTLLLYISPGMLSGYTIGAIGLGSSNDFHKPISMMICGIPAALDFEHAALRDICSLDYDNGRRYFMINASIGITAEANYRFNHPDALLTILKKVHTGSAILLAAAETIAGYKNIPVCLSRKESEQHCNVTNLGILKNPHFSGSFRYDDAAVYNDGLLRVYLAGDMNKREIPSLMNALARGKFRRVAKTSSFSAEKLAVSAEQEFTVECDGETVKTKKAIFSVYKEAVKVCR